MVRLTAIVPTFNEAAGIAACLDALCFCDEIIVIDSFSTDNTVEIARRYTDRIVSRAWSGSNGAKEAGRVLARGAWVLQVDADEIVSPTLRRAIEAALDANDTRISGYQIPIVSYFRDRRLRFGGVANPWRIRLFQTARGRWDTTIEPHDRLIVSGPTARFSRSSVLRHTIYDDHADLFEKSLRYARLWAETSARAGKRATTFHLVARPLYRFLRDYIFRLGFLMGSLGFITCCAHAYYTFLKYALLGRERAP